MTIHEPLKIVCAWCSTLIQAGPPTPVSHGLCLSCQQQLLDQLEAE